MGTRSDIIVHRADGQWHRIYCHWDGYLEHNGRILFDHYTSQAQADALVALGDLSSLGEIIGEKHDFDWRMKLPRKKNGFTDENHPEFKRLDAMCLAYGRDRGESDTAGDVGETLQAVWPDEDTWTEFTYVWHDGKWWVTSPDEGTQTLVDLGEALQGKVTVRATVKAFGAVIGAHAPTAPGKPHEWGSAR